LQVEGRKEDGVELTRAPGQTCSDSTIEAVRSRLDGDFEVRTSNQEVGRETENFLAHFSRRDRQGGFIVETIQVQFGPEERQFKKETLIRNLSEIVDTLNGRVASSGD